MDIKTKTTTVPHNKKTQPNDRTVEDGKLDKQEKDWGKSEKQKGKRAIKMVMVTTRGAIKR